MFKKTSDQGSTSPDGQTRSMGDGYREALSWESSTTLLMQQSQARAWFVAKCFGFAFVLSVVAIALMMPLKEAVPYVIFQDNKTGVPDIVTVLDEKGVGYNEVMDKYWLAQYVRARETYDWYTLQKDYNMVGLLSSNSVGASYSALFEGKDALDKKFGESVRATVEVVSVVPTDRGTGVVRFIKTTKRADDDGTGVVTKWVATVAYQYRNPSLIKESQRLVNPFGFQVMSYRVDPEVLGGAQ